MRQFETHKGPTQSKIFHLKYFAIIEDSFNWLGEEDKDKRINEIKKEIMMNGGSVVLESLEDNVKN